MLQSRCLQQRCSQPSPPTALPGRPRPATGPLGTTRPGLRPRQACAREGCRRQRLAVNARGGGERHQREQPEQQVESWLRKALAVSAAAAAAVLLQLPVNAAQQQAVLRFPASPNPRIFAAQKTLVEAWSIVDEAFVDAGFAGHNWEDELGKALSDAYKAKDEKAAYEKIGGMLAVLGDPFTRIVQPSEYADFRVSSDGEVQGVGLLIASSPEGRLLVLAPIAGGPADRAGVRPGDEVLSIDGKTTEGFGGAADDAAKLLRGKIGSSVDVRFARRSEQVPGVAGRPEELPRVEYRQVSLQRERLELSPVFSTAVAHGPHTLGYIRLVNFSQRAAHDMQAAMSSLEKQGVEGYVLDLRNNPGGLVRAGIDVARLWLEGAPPLFNVQGRDVDGMHNLIQRVVLEEGHAASQRPLAVLVNQNSASASEILAGALVENGRATLIGDRTYGKGKIQSVFELEDGSALFVTVARYKTPQMRDIDQHGIVPEATCTSPEVTAGGPLKQASRGLPLGPEAQELVASELTDDSCMLTAQRLLEGKLDGETQGRTPLLASLTAPPLSIER